MADSDPFTDITRNVCRACKSMRACIDAGVRRVVFLSTAGVMYGSSSTARIEQSAPRPVSPYRIGKLAVEGFLEYYRERYDLEHLIHRVSSPSGGRQSVMRS